MTIDFNFCVILDVRTGKTKSGNDFAVLRFLDQEGLEVYEVFCFGDSMAAALGLTKGANVRLLFELHSLTSGAGVRLTLTGVGSPC